MKTKLDVVANAFNFSTQKAEVGGLCDFKASLIHTVKHYSEKKRSWLKARCIHT